MQSTRSKANTAVLRMAVPASILALALTASLQAGTDSDDWPAWVDEQQQLAARIDAVNEGALVFLADQPVSGVHHHSGRVSITPQSLQDGWVVLEQCHADLDQVTAAQIVFNPTRSRLLQVISVRNIEQAFTEGNTIQLRGVSAHSEVCLRAESRALKVVDSGVFELQNGPFMRRFLDGYYPLKLSLQVDFPPTLELVDFQPDAQPGFAVDDRPGRLTVETVFEGQLRTVFRFIEE